MTTLFAKHLKALMQQHKVNASELARHTTINQSVIHRILDSSTLNPLLSTLVALAEYFHISIDDLVGYKAHKTNESSLTLGTLIPLFYQNQLQQTRDPNQAYEHEMTLLPVSKNCFGFVLLNNAMAPKFGKGCTVLIEPDAVIEDGDYVLFYHEQNQQCIFRQFLTDGTHNILKAYQEPFSSKEAPDIKNLKFLGVMVQAIYHSLRLPCTS
jgi:transcriptional regulator with XRE-family HTH domain